MSVSLGKAYAGMAYPEFPVHVLDMSGAELIRAEDVPPVLRNHARSTLRSADYADYVWFDMGEYRLPGGGYASLLAMRTAYSGLRYAREV